jgi:hypothetical protein
MGLKSKIKEFAQNNNRSNNSPPRRQSNLLVSSPKNSNNHYSGSANNSHSNGNNNATLLSMSPVQIQSSYVGRKEFTKDGNLNFRILAFAGGISVILTSTLSILISMAHWGVLEVMVYLYTLLFGVLICILEGQIH